MQILFCGTRRADTVDNIAHFFDDKTLWQVDMRGINTTKAIGGTTFHTMKMTVHLMRIALPGVVTQTILLSPTTIVNRMQEALGREEI